MEKILYGVETEFGMEFFEIEDDAIGYASMMNDDHEYPVRKFLLNEIAMCGNNHVLEEPMTVSIKPTLVADDGYQSRRTTKI